LKICAKNKRTNGSKSVALQRIKIEFIGLALQLCSLRKDGENTEARHNRTINCAFLMKYKDRKQTDRGSLSAGYGTGRGNNKWVNIETKLWRSRYA